MSLFIYFFVYRKYIERKSNQFKMISIFMYYKFVLPLKPDWAFDVIPVTIP